MAVEGRVEAEEEGKVEAEVEAELAKEDTVERKVVSQSQTMGSGSGAERSGR